MENLLIAENILTKEECETIIDENKDLTKASEKDWNYNYKDLTINPVLNRAANFIVNQYCNNFPSINLTMDRWELNSFRLKHFPPEHSFNAWHSEHTYQYPYRVAGILIYLTEHNCGTEFYTGEVIKSEVGRAIMFPAFWTHTHRGQVCPDKKSRYILSAYLHLKQ